jgi:hypothetical protein
MLSCIQENDFKSQAALSLILSNACNGSTKTAFNQMGFPQPLHCQHFLALGGHNNLLLRHEAAVPIPQSFDQPIPIPSKMIEANYEIFVHFVRRSEWAFLRFHKTSDRFRCLTCMASHHCQHWAKRPADKSDTNSSQTDTNSFEEEIASITKDGKLLPLSHSQIPFRKYSEQQKQKMLSRTASLINGLPNGKLISNLNT